YFIPDHPETRGRLYRWSERGFDLLLRGYRRTLDGALRHPLLVVLSLAAVLGLNAYLYVAIPKGFFPQQDTGRLIGRIQADQSTSFQLMRTKLAEFVDIVRADPAVDAVVGFTGGAQTNTGSVFVALKSRAERGISIDELMARLRRKLARVAGATLFLQPVQDIRMGARQSNALYQYTLQADSLADLRTWTPRLVNALAGSRDTV